MFGKKVFEIDFSLYPIWIAIEMKIINNICKIIFMFGEKVFQIDFSLYPIWFGMEWNWILNIQNNFYVW